MVLILEKAGLEKFASGAVARYRKEQVRRQNTYGFRSFAAVQHEGLALWTEVVVVFRASCPNGGAFIHNERILGLVSAWPEAQARTWRTKVAAVAQEANNNIPASISLFLSYYSVILTPFKLKMNNTHYYSLHHIIINFSNDYYDDILHIMYHFFIVKNVYGSTIIILKRFNNLACVQINPYDVVISLPGYLERFRSAGFG